jgi:hypothetical protein
METILRYWGYRSQMWRIAGFTSPTTIHAFGGPAGVHPIVEVLQTSVIVVGRGA